MFIIKPFNRWLRNTSVTDVVYSGSSCEGRRVCSSSGRSIYRSCCQNMQCERTINAGINSAAIWTRNNNKIYSTSSHLGHTLLIVEAIVTKPESYQIYTECLLVEPSMKFETFCIWLPATHVSFFFFFVINKPLV